MVPLVTCIQELKGLLGSSDVLGSHALPHAACDQICDKINHALALPVKR